MPNLPKLNPDPSATTEIQRTSLSLDVLARDFLNTLDESLDGNDHFDVIVLGAGMYGAYAASKFFRLGGAARPRVLVLETGPFLLPEHIQNFPARLGYGVFREVDGKPYSAKIKEPGAANRDESVADHYYCVGGKSLAWGKWCPRLTEEDLAQWPADVADALRREYPVTEQELGVKPESDFIFGPLFDALLERAADVLPTNPAFTEVLPPPVAAQSGSAASGLFSFDAFSSVALLLDAIRYDIGSHGHHPAGRKLLLVPNCRAYKFETSGSAVTGIKVLDGNGAVQRTVEVHGAAVYLAMGSVESTRLVLNTLGPAPNPATRLIGRNLMVHLRTDFNVRIHRSALRAGLPERLEAAALHVQGSTEGRRFHVQILAAADNNRNAEEALYKLLPDISDLQNLLDNQVDDWVSLRCILCGELKGDPLKPLYADDSCWMDLSPHNPDTFGGVTIPRAFVQFALTGDDDEHWLTIHERALDLVQAMAGDPTKIEYQQPDGSWLAARPARAVLRSYRNSLGSSFHESGMMWMGDDAEASVTTTSGRIRQFDNLYCLDQAVFPTVGSANPVLTGMALVRKFVTDALPDFESDIEPLHDRLASRLEQDAWRLDNGQPLNAAESGRVADHAESMLGRDQMASTAAPTSDRWARSKRGGSRAAKRVRGFVISPETTTVLQSSHDDANELSQLGSDGDGSATRLASAVERFRAALSDGTP